MSARDETDRATVSEGCKQLKIDGRHFADCVSPEAARVVADCINYSGLPQSKWPPEAAKRVAEFFA